MTDADRAALKRLPEGPHAYPSTFQLPSGAWVMVQGMMLRDYFAAQAVAGLDCSTLTAATVARQAYDIADALMAERAFRDIKNNPAED